jgi:hypothetical protein
MRLCRLALLLALLPCCSSKPKAADPTTLADPPAGDADDASSCSGSGAKISVVALGEGDCQVTLGSERLGFAPIMNKVAPVGVCKLTVSCPDGHVFSQTMTLKVGSAEKAIIKPDMWQ